MSSPGNPSERSNNGPVNYPYPGQSVNHDYSVVAKDLRVDSYVKLSQVRGKIAILDAKY